MTSPDLSRLETPCLLLERERLQRNATVMLEKAARHGLYLRPHVKTSKCVEVAEIATGGRVSGLTASTLNEVDFFSRAGRLRPSSRPLVPQVRASQFRGLD